MTNGIEINQEEFKKMKIKEQMAILFENTESIKKAVNSYKLHQKIQYAAIGGLGSGLIYAIKIVFEHLNK